LRGIGLAEFFIARRRLLEARRVVGVTLFGGVDAHDPLRGTILRQRPFHPSRFGEMGSELTGNRGAIRHLAGKLRRGLGSRRRHVFTGPVVRRLRADPKVHRHGRFSFHF